MDRIVERCCGLDVHNSSVTACVRITEEGGRVRQITEEFAATTQGLLLLRDWLASFEVELVSMEATGVYWKPIYYMLEDDFELWLLNAEHLKGTSPAGRLTSRTPSGSASSSSTALCAPALCRQRRSGSLKEPYPLPQGADRGAHQGSTAPGEGAAGGRHQALLCGHPCTRSLRQGFCADALIEGTTDPEILAELARGRLRSKIPALQEALEGSFSAHHALMASRILAHIDYLDETIAELSSEIERVLDPFSEEIALLDTIPGVNRKVAEMIIAEIGVDMSRFPTHYHLASWA